MRQLLSTGRLKLLIAANDNRQMTLSLPTDVFTFSSVNLIFANIV